MPELPEVETVVRKLNKTVLGRKIEDVWSDNEKTVKRPKSFKQFKEAVIGEKLEKAERRGKNILIGLSRDKILLVHQKMTGHLLYGKWRRVGRSWKPEGKGPLGDPANRFVHLLFFLDNGKQLALSDLRKFAKVELWDGRVLLQNEGLKSLGPEPLEKSFTLEKFKQILCLSRGKIKQVLMDQSVIAGIGNIYSDEILWEARIHPLRRVENLKAGEPKKVYEAMKKILREGIKRQGDSMSDYRLLSGEKGRYQEFQKVYRQEGKPCPRKDGGVIERLKIGGRSAHFCLRCQK